VRENRFRLEAALTRLELAELLVDRYPTQWEEAAQHLNTAVAELRAMKMPPALRRKGVVGAPIKTIYGYGARRRWWLFAISSVSPRAQVSPASRHLKLPNPCD
jgi:hypothetical protein